ncbi:hypothetical protein NHQ30_009760 [Ciborinia camelliae]|nr:hypothetical protein NHQ30_009760 [Ciborinia camelliae]
MMNNLINLNILSSILSLASFVSANPIFQRDTPIPFPSEDQFYYPPEYFEYEPPGTILKCRHPPNSLAAFGVVPMELHATYQILYRTTSADGSPSHTVTTVLVPMNANYSRLVSQQDFMDSACFDCSTSFALQQGASRKTLQSQSTILYIAGLLNEGYIVSIPDYEGPKASFSCGLSSGYALLDSIRAVSWSGRFTGVKMDADVVMWGYSGGSIPTHWAAQLHATYAPELNILGAAIGGNIPNLESTIRSINKGPSAGYAAAGIMGLMAEYEELDKLLTKYLIQETREEFEMAKTRCAMENGKVFKNKDISKYFVNGFDWFDHPIVREILMKTGIMGLMGTPRMPIHMYKSVSDTMAPIADDDALVAQYCADGGQVQYERNLRGTHPTESFLGCSSALTFLRNLLDGKGAPPGCSITDVNYFTPNWADLLQAGESVVGIMKEFISKEGFEVAEDYVVDEVNGWWHDLFGSDYSAR